MKKHLKAILCLTLALLTLALCCSCGGDNGGSGESGSSEEYVEPVAAPLSEEMTDLAFVGGGMASFRDAQTGKLGLIDSKGEKLVEAEYASVKYCALELFVILTKEDGSEYTYDPDDKSIVEGNLCAHGFPSPFFWDAATQSVVYFEIEASPVPEADLPAEGEAQIIYDLETRKVGLVGHDGKLIVEPVYDEAMPFVNGCAAVRQNGKWGYINARGKTVIDFYYDAAYLSVACDSVGEGRPYNADKNGIIILNHDGIYGIYNGGGDMICPFKYRDIIVFGDGNYAALNPDGSWILGNLGGIAG